MSVKKTLFTLLLALVMISVSQQAQAQLTLSFGNLDLAPNTAGQTIEIFVTGGSPVDSLDLNVLVGDGGAIAGGSNPNFNFIQAVDIITGTIFDGNNNGVSGARLAQDGFAFDSTTTASGTVAAGGLIATLTLDTTGLNSGSFNISTDSGAAIQGPTLFAGANGLVTPTQANGVINIVNVLKGDVNMDGDVDFADIPPFIAVLQTGVFQAEADCDCNTVITFADIPAFIAILQNQ